VRGPHASSLSSTLSPGQNRTQPATHAPHDTILQSCSRRRPSTVLSPPPPTSASLPRSQAPPPLDPPSRRVRLPHGRRAPFFHLSRRLPLQPPPLFLLDASSIGHHEPRPCATQSHLGAPSRFRRRSPGSPPPSSSVARSLACIIMLPVTLVVTSSSTRPWFSHPSYPCTQRLWDFAAGLRRCYQRKMVLLT
jgi:hypothetical protein